MYIYIIYVKNSFDLTSDIQWNKLCTLYFLKLVLNKKDLCHLASWHKNIFIYAITTKKRKNDFKYYRMTVFKRGGY